MKARKLREWIECVKESATIHHLKMILNLYLENGGEFNDEMNEAVCSFYWDDEPTDEQFKKQKLESYFYLNHDSQYLLYRDEHRKNGTGYFKLEKRVA